jgi:nucleoside-diphosphate-sugar epimerase
MTTSLVTGHLGFVGRHLCRALRKRGDAVVGLDWQEGNDILDCPLPADVDQVYHLAAQTDATSEDAYAGALTNIVASIRIFEKYREKCVFASSSMAHYPVTPYAISKRTCEYYARIYGVRSIRFCNLYGGDGSHSVIDKFKVAERISIYGTGNQLRTYAPVSTAVDALLAPHYRGCLPGRDWTVNEIASWSPDKPVDRLPKKPNDLLYGAQISNS